MLPTRQAAFVEHKQTYSCPRSPAQTVTGKFNALEKNPELAHIFEDLRRRSRDFECFDVHRFPDIPS